MSKHTNITPTRYDPTKSYRKGQWIFHPVFKDRGQIIKKQSSSFPYDKIIVEFENEGLKVLIENMPKKDKQK